MFSPFVEKKHLKISVTRVVHFISVLADQLILDHVLLSLMQLMMVSYHSMVFISINLSTQENPQKSHRQLLDNLLNITQLLLGVHMNVDIIMMAPDLT